MKAPTPGRVRAFGIILVGMCLPRIIISHDPGAVKGFWDFRGKDGTERCLPPSP